MAQADVHPLVVLSLELQGETFAIETGQVREILDPVPVTQVPGADPAVNGLINVRGRVVPLADLRLIFGMPQQEAGPDARIVVIEVELDGDPVTIGIRADKVSEVTELAAASLEATPRIGLRWEQEFIACIGKRAGAFIAVLDMARIFARMVRHAQSSKHAPAPAHAEPAAPAPGAAHDSTPAARGMQASSHSATGWTEPRP